jgi:hypothetical protein
MVPERLQATENARTQGESMVSAVAELIRAERGGDQGDVAGLLKAQEARHKKEMADFRKEVMATLKGKAPAATTET